MGRKECLSVCLSVSTHNPIISRNDARNLAEALLYMQDMKVATHP